MAPESDIYNFRSISSMPADIQADNFPVYVTSQRIARFIAQQRLFEMTLLKVFQVLQLSMKLGLRLRDHL